MSYLSRVTVDKRTAIQRRLNDSYAWHKAVWEAFPNWRHEERRFLTRVDDRGRFYQVLVLSEERPSLPDWGQWEVKTVSPSFLQHERYLFSLRVNATVKRVVRDESGERRKNGRRTAICKREELEAWLKRKSQQCGFEVEHFDADPPMAQPFRKNGKAGKHVRLDFRGVLRVSDTHAFKEAFSKGIGSAKAFGCGLLMLQPLHG